MKLNSSLSTSEGQWKLLLTAWHLNTMTAVAVWDVWFYIDNLIPKRERVTGKEPLPDRKVMCQVPDIFVTTLFLTENYS